MSRNFRRSPNLDPRRTTAKFQSHCSTCGDLLRKGDGIIYFPASRQAFCFPCGEPDYLAFLSSKADEEAYNRTGTPFCF